MGSAVPKGSPSGGFLIKDPTELATATNSTHFRGFVFVGNGTVELSTTKGRFRVPIHLRWAHNGYTATLPQYNPRRSINGVWELLLEGELACVPHTTLYRSANIFLEKGDGPWNPARASLLKKLKKCMRRSSGSRSLTSSPASHGLSTLESTSSPESQTGSGTDEGSEYSGSEDDLEVEAQSPLPSSRPTDPSKAVEYDAIKAVWAPRNKILVADVIRSSLADYWDLMRRLRDQWKSEATALQQAELKNDQGTTIRLRDSVNEKRRLIESCIRIALSHGHRDIIQRYVNFFDFVFPIHRPQSDYKYLRSPLHPDTIRMPGMISWRTIRIACQSIKCLQGLLKTLLSNALLHLCCI